MSDELMDQQGEPGPGDPKAKAAAWDRYVSAGIPQDKATALVEARTDTLPAAHHWDALVKAGVPQDKATAAVAAFGATPTAAPDKPGFVDTLKGAASNVWDQLRTGGPLNVIDKSVVRPMAEAAGKTFLAPVEGDRVPGSDSWSQAKLGTFTQPGATVQPGQGITRKDFHSAAAQTGLNALMMGLPAAGRAASGAVEAANVAGTAAPRAAQLFNSAIGRTATAAGVGSAAGAASSPDNMGNAAAVGALLGGVGHAVVSGGTKAVGSLYKTPVAAPTDLPGRINMLPAETQAHTLDALTGGEKPAADVLQRPGALTMDAAPELARTVRSAGNRAAQQAIDAPLNARHAQQSTQIKSAIADAAGIHPESFDAATPDIIARQKAQAQENYGKAYAAPDIKDPDVLKMLELPGFREAYGAASRNTHIETGSPLPSLEVPEAPKAPKASAAAAGGMDWDGKAASLRSQGVPDSKIEAVLGKRPGGAPKEGGLYTEARTNGGDARDYAKVTTEGLIKEQKFLADRSATNTAAAPWVREDGNMSGTTAFGMRSGYRTGRALFEGDGKRIQAIDAELARRGVPAHESSAMLQKLYDDEEAAGSHGSADEGDGDTSFDFGKGAPPATSDAGAAPQSPAQQQGISVRGLDLTKRWLDSYVRGNQNSVRGLSALDAAALSRRLGTDFLPRIDEQVPAYKAARASFAGDAKLLDAAEAGARDAASPTVRDADIRKTIAALSPGEQELYRKTGLNHYWDKIDDVAGSATGNANAVRQAFLSSVGGRGKLRAFMPTPDAADAVESHINTALEQSRIKQLIQSGSQTVDKAAQLKALNDTFGASASGKAGQLIDLATHPKSTLLSHGLGMIDKGLDAKRAAAATAGHATLADLLAQSGPDGLAAIEALQAGAKRPAAAAPSMLRPALTGIGAGANTGAGIRALLAPPQSPNR